MKETKNKLKVFISSKIGDTLADQKYTLARVAAKELLESTGLFKVYGFEFEGPSTNSALEHYTEALEESDVCVFLIDNKDGVPSGVQNEIDTVKKYRIPSLYYFCQGAKKKRTQAQIDLSKASEPKFIIINSFDEFIKGCADHVIEDVLQTYKKFNKLKITQNNVFEEEQSSSQISKNTHTNIKIEENKSVNVTTVNKILGKEQLANKVCREFFADLIFGKGKEESDKKSFDLYCSKFLSIIFENSTIENFNMNLFLEALSSILPKPYYEVIEKRWISNQKYLLAEYDVSIEILKESLKLAQSYEGQIAEWLIQDILVDLRNRENSVAETKNHYLSETIGQRELDNRAEKLHYPLIDRNEKNLYEWIEKERQRNELKSFATWHSYGDLSFVSNFIADIYYQSMMFGSFTHISRIYTLIQKLSYQLSKSTNYWPAIMMLLKTTIISLDNKKVNQITSNFSELMEKMNSADAKEIYNFSSNARLTHNQFKANLIAMSEVGYYLNDNDFNQSWNSLKSQISLWLAEENSMVSMHPHIFRCIQRINERLEEDYIVEFAISVLESNRKRYYSDALNLLSRNYVDYKKVSAANSDRLIQVLMKHTDKTDDYNEIKKIKTVFILLRNESSDKRNEVNSYIEKSWPEFYLTEYMFERAESKESGNLLMKSRINNINNRNLNQGKNGVYSGYSNDPYLEAESILIESKEAINQDLIDELFIETTNTITSSNQLVEDKLKAYNLAVFLTRFDINIIDRNKSQVELIKSYNDYQFARESMISYADSTTLILSHLLLLECLGMNKYPEILEVISAFSEPGRQVEACKIMQRYLHNYKDITIKKDLESLLLQCSLIWANSDNLNVRWHNIHVLIRLMESKKNKKSIGQKLQSIMNSENAVIKSQIVHKLSTITKLDASIGNVILESAINDNNYVIRKIAINRKK